MPQKDFCNTIPPKADVLRSLSDFHNVDVARSTRADMQRIPHSITSSARVSMVGGTSTPIAFKVGLLRSEQTLQGNRHASGQPLPSG